jgi:hypothetical protein
MWASVYIVGLLEVAENDFVFQLIGIYGEWEPKLLNFGYEFIKNVLRNFQNRTSNLWYFNFSWHFCNMEHADLYPAQHTDLTVLLRFPETN